MIIDESYPEVADHPGRSTSCAEPARARTELDPIDPDDEGQADYSGALLSDLDFGAFSHSALVRIADEVCLQMHLLNLSFVIAVRQARGHRHRARDKICTKQLIGIAGIAAERIHRALELPGGVEGALRMLELHPLLNPAAYVTADFGPDTVARAHGRPPTRTVPGSRWSRPSTNRPLQAIVAAVDPHLDVRGHRNRHRLDGASDRNRHGGKGIASRLRCASSAAARRGCSSRGSRCR